MQQSTSIVYPHINYQKNDDVKDKTMPPVTSVTPMTEGNFQNNHTANRYQQSIYNM